MTSEIDKLTLELMMNKSQYKKYLAKREPTKFKEQEEDIQRIRDNRDGILEIFANLLDKPNAQYTHNIENHFECFVKEAIEYIETQAYMKKDTESNDLFPVEKPKSPVKNSVNTHKITATSWHNFPSK